MRELAEWQLNTKKRGKGMLVDIVQSNKFSLQVLHSLPSNLLQYSCAQSLKFYFLLTQNILATISSETSSKKHLENLTVLTKCSNHENIL